MLVNASNFLSALFTEPEALKIFFTSELLGIYPLRSVLVYDIRNDVRSVACAREILFVNDTGLEEVIDVVGWSLPLGCGRVSLLAVCLPFCEVILFWREIPIAVTTTSLIYMSLVIFHV